ncbi:MAG: response regulator [Thioploca sp.]|nr:response regulator [Thioploca sp.]
MVQSRAQAKALQEAKEKVEVANRAKQEFLNSMSHELNTPLHTLLGYLQILQDSSLTWQQRSHLASIRQSSEHLHSLVNAILDTARLEHQQSILNPAPCVLPELLKHVVDMIQLKAQSKGLHFEFLQPQPLPVEILVDALRLRQILLNLLTNAVKYTPTGYVRLLVTVTETNDQQAVLTIAVYDSGIGIPSAEQNRLLQPFERGNTLGQSGAGLGLSIVRQLLQKMASQLEIESSSQGSCFRFRLEVLVLRPPEAVATPSLLSPPVVPPLAVLQTYQQDLLLGRLPTLKHQLEQLAQQPQYQLFANQALQFINSGDKTQLHTLLNSFFPTDTPILSLTDLHLEADPQHPQLLVIDDDSFNIHLIAHYLRDFDFDLLSANSGVAGLQLARHTRPQLILLDIYMPTMTGFEVCQQLKADEQLHAIPVIFFSASTKAKDIAAAFAHQGQDYIFKPAREEEVIARITAHLQQSTLHYPLINRLLAYNIQQETEIYMETSAANEEVTQQTIKTLDKIYQVRELLLDNLKNQPKLEEIARQVGLNRNKLNEEFKVLFGNTIFAWLYQILPEINLMILYII